MRPGRWWWRPARSRPATPPRAWARRQGAAAAAARCWCSSIREPSRRPSSSAAPVSEHLRLGGLLSIQPYRRMRRIRDRLVAFVDLVTAMAVGGMDARRTRRAGHGRVRRLHGRATAPSTSRSPATSSSARSPGYPALARRFAGRGPGRPHPARSRMRSSCTRDRARRTGRRARRRTCSPACAARRCAPVPRIGLWVVATALPSRARARAGPGRRAWPSAQRCTRRARSSSRSSCVASGTTDGRPRCSTRCRCSRSSARSAWSRLHRPPYADAVIQSATIAGRDVASLRRPGTRSGRRRR